ncbi:response regulator [Nostoc sp. FACHB-888]|uniref:response regulator n=1 Tax=Nostoc sp. FACHB-888 TaxID=2692842 RepID=UPI001F552921|nr:response regulator [Nostoc sp. FACHB-888]
MMNYLQTLKGLRVLVVDDNLDHLELIQFILEQYNVQVTAVTSAYEAFNVIKLLQANILICDIQMPVEDGYSLIRQIRNLTQKIKGIPAIALTTCTSDETRHLVLNAGFSTYLTKPFDPDELIAVLSNLVTEHIASCA